MKLLITASRSEEPSHLFLFHMEKGVHTPTCLDSLNNYHYDHFLTLLIFNYRKDVRLPIQLQRAMAAEAEATREAKAKVSTKHD